MSYSKKLLIRSCLALIAATILVGPAPIVAAGTASGLDGAKEYSALCKDLKPIRGSKKIYKDNCRSPQNQNQQDTYVQNICQKYGDNKLKKQCQAYSDATIAQRKAKGCKNGVCSDPAANPKADCDKNTCDLIQKYINPAINLLSISFGLIAIISIIAGGIQYSASAGDPQKVSNAKKRITNTIIAIVCYFFLYGFLQFIIPGGVFNR